MLSSALSNIPLSTSLVTPVLRMVCIRWKACAPLTVAASVAKRGLSHGDPERGHRWGQGAGLCFGKGTRAQPEPSTEGGQAACAGELIERSWPPRERSPSCSSGRRSTRTDQPRAAGDAARALLFGARNLLARFPPPGSHGKDRTNLHHLFGFFDSGPKPISLLVSQAPIKQGCSPTGARYFSSQYFFPRAPRMSPEVRERAAGCEESSVGVARPQDTSLLWPSSAFPQLTSPVIKVSS